MMIIALCKQYGVRRLVYTSSIEGETLWPLPLCVFHCLTRDCHRSTGWSALRRLKSCTTTTAVCWPTRQCSRRRDCHSAAPPLSL